MCHSPSPGPPPAWPLSPPPPGRWTSTGSPTILTLCRSMVELSCPLLMEPIILRLMEPVRRGGFFNGKYCNSIHYRELTILWPGNVSGLKANGSSFKKNGSNITANGPITSGSENDELQEIHENEPDGADEKGVPDARSTDLIFLKSVVLTNTLERPKKVCVSNFLLLPQILRKSKNLMGFDKWNSA